MLNETVSIRKHHINYFVLAEWHLSNEQLCVYFEKDQSAEIIKCIDFTLNPNSKYRLK